MTIQLRRATGDDLNALFRLEQSAFTGDCFNRRQLWYLLNRAHAETWALECDAEAPMPAKLLGYGTLLFRLGSSRARLYSFCVHPESRGSGLGRQLLETLEGAARSRGCTRLGLEVRADNGVAKALYRRMGFRLERCLPGYYEDGCAAWQMLKSLETEVLKEEG
ncbi:GNAT family N-acetyltransferase [Halomonas marinisediminis]|uniref:GNAT family N-acetyltransferase n=1 Tax=Halomonas marinisediminis TaxID=2546095 RepID=A0ABY2D9M1_9GAMM|nr:GNAT family N-acetyltransferase [Halomonas marinisediminis]TDB02365.1 GNAT family N-acetyltransferase [Halomonas marinisediminis]